MPCNWLMVLVCSHACKNIHTELYLSPYLAEISEFNSSYGQLSAASPTLLLCCCMTNCVRV